MISDTVIHIPIKNRKEKRKIFFEYNLEKIEFRIRLLPQGLLIFKL